MNIIQTIKRLFIKRYNTGVVEDFRNEDLKKKDWFHEEIALGAQYSTYATKEDVKFKYPFENQRTTSSCVAHATALCMGIDNELEGNGFIRLSPYYIYRQRMNYPSEGMILADSGEIAKDYGSCPVEYIREPDSESQANALESGSTTATTWCIGGVDGVFSGGSCFACWVRPSFPNSRLIPRVRS